jgi:transforming growth factor-beta-induced protein
VNKQAYISQDLTFNGGVVQVIDSLLIPPSNLTDTLNSFNITSFEGAVYAADLVSTFTDTPNVTIFAPADSAFQSLGPAIANMTSDELASILDYTILPQVVYSTGLKNGTKFLASQGENITVLHSGNNVYINSAQLLTSDILIANGVLHVIDNVLNPQGPGAMPNPALPTQVPAFASASQVDYLPYTSAIPCTTSCPVTGTSSSSSSGSIATSSTGGHATGKTASTTTSHSSSSSKGLAAAMARETGFGAAGLLVALGGAVLMI